jgi:type III pantothenate kinase
MSAFPLIAVDIGNNRIKLGLFESAVGQGLPEPGRMLQVSGAKPDFEQVTAWLAPYGPADVSWWIGSVNRPTTTRLVDWLRSTATESRVTLLASGDLPLRVALERPDMVGVDRLLDAVAANCLRGADRPAVVIDVGSAITVDLVSADGVFRGGAIAPGIGMSAQALHTFTDLLPLVDMSELAEAPPALGTSTVAAMRSGLFWGAVGLIRQLTHEMTAGMARPPHVFLTGGAGPAVAELLGPETQYIPHLTLAGIALVAKG